MTEPSPQESMSVICHRCGAVMKPGDPLFYVVRIEAFPFPQPPNLNEEDLQRDFRSLMAELLEQMADLSSQELMDQVYRRMTLHLCPVCYARWIEDPTG